MRVGCTYILTCAYCGSAARCWYGMWPVHIVQVVGLAESSYQLLEFTTIDGLGFSKVDLVVFL